MSYPPTTGLRFSLYSEGRDISYDQIGMFAGHTGEPATEITEQEYEYLLNCLPPIRTSRGGYIVPEPITSNRFGQAHSMIVQTGGRYYAKWVTLGKLDTYIDDVAIATAHALTPDAAS